jgi:hypothetical protein
MVVITVVTVVCGIAGVVVSFAAGTVVSLAAGAVVAGIVPGIVVGTFVGVAAPALCVPRTSGCAKNMAVGRRTMMQRAIAGMSHFLRAGDKRGPAEAGAAAGSCGAGSAPLSALPQFLQNFFPGATSFPQLPQYGIPVRSVLTVIYSCGNLS